MKVHDLNTQEEGILSQEEEQEANIDSWFGTQIIPSSILSSLTQSQSSQSPPVLQTSLPQPLPQSLPQQLPQSVPLLLSETQVHQLLSQESQQSSESSESTLSLLSRAHSTQKSSEQSQFLSQKSSQKLSQKSR
jgi:Golgi nucleoside diphosphatase